DFDIDSIYYYCVCFQINNRAADDIFLLYRGWRNRPFSVEYRGWHCGHPERNLDYPFGTRCRDRFTGYRYDLGIDRKGLDPDWAHGIVVLPNLLHSTKANTGLGILGVLVRQQSRGYRDFNSTALGCAAGA